MQLPARARVGAWLLVVSGCGSTPDLPAPRAPTEVRYGPARATKLTPFPSNRYTRPDPSAATGLRVQITTDTTADSLATTYSSISSQLNEQDGFSVIGGITLHFTRPLGPASVDRTIEQYRAGEAPLRLIDVDPLSPERGTSRGLVVHYYPDDLDDRGDAILIAQPSTPLRPKTTYLFVGTDGIVDEAGVAVHASEDMLRVVGGEPAGAYEHSVRSALDSLVDSKAIAREHVVVATLFTTESVHEQTFAMAAALRASPAPTLAGSVVLDKTSEADGRIAFRGHFAAPEWRSAIDGRFRFDDKGAPIAQKENSLEVLIVFTDRATVGPRPIVVFAHGLTSSKESAWDVAEALADRGVVVVAIDAPEHGSRATITKGDTFATAFAFFSVDFTHKTFDLARGRDNFRQMSSDQLQLVRALRGPLGALDLLPSGAPDGLPDLDPDRIAYLGTSFGSVLGPTALALAPELSGGVLNVGGGGLTTVVFHSPAFQLLLPGLFQPATPKGEMARIFSAGQALYDPGDPLNYAAFVTLRPPPGSIDWMPRSVLVQEAIDDALVPNESTALLARTMGLTHVSPTRVAVDDLPVAPAPFSGNLEGGATGGLFQFDRADGKPADHNTLLQSTEGRAQHGEFLEALFERKPCVVRDPYPKGP